MPKEDFEANLEDVLIDSESKIQSAETSELGDENRLREMDGAVNAFTALSQREFQKGQLENERLKIEKDTEVRIQEIKSEERKENTKTAVTFLTFLGSGFMTWAGINYLTEFEKTNSLTSTSIREISKNFFRNAFRGLHF